ncbi:MAG: CocE/NonD family hydrolase [Bacteroidales bacterium]|nr:CocE/NonD family hydrolase [Bacteroidales bacterium]
MKTILTRSNRICLFILLMAWPFPGAVHARLPVPDAPSEPDFTVREEMVPMRDGVRLYTLILEPAEPAGPLPVLLLRTPYNANQAPGDLSASSLRVVLGTQFLGPDYIYVFQDIRGRYRSEGEYFMYRPPMGPFNRTSTDESTDAWDSIDWLVKNLSTNARVGIWGTSYPGWLTLAAMRNPHPALAAAVPFNPVVDTWKADDWFHWGAFRGVYAFDFIYGMETFTDTYSNFPYEQNELYSWMLPPKALDKSLGTRLDERHEMWQRLMEFPAYGPYWKEVAADQWFESPSRIVPALHVHGFWDQEDIYGSPAAYAALERFDTANNLNFFAAGPWYHGQHFEDGSSLGQLQFGHNTAERFREKVLSPFLRHFLHDLEPSLPYPVTVFETGSLRWQHFESWPPAVQEMQLYLQPGGKLSFSPPDRAESFTAYSSDPEHPVPFKPRPVWNMDYGNAPALKAWQRWLVEDQRFVDGRPDVRTWVSEPLTESLTLRGPVLAQLFAETTGSDADWVVKLIDVYAGVEEDFEMSGFQLMVSGEIFRGRYREDYENPVPIEPDKALLYEIPLPQVNHTFLPGHRIMVQVQSTWFPLYDLNPQTFVPSIMTAPDSAYRVQRHRIHHSASFPTYIRVYRDQSR